MEKELNKMSIDLTFSGEVIKDFNKYVPKLLDLVRSKGGVVAERAILTPTEALELNNVNSPWIKEFYGQEFETWDDVLTNTLESIDTGAKIENEFQRALAESLKRQKANVINYARKKLSTNLSLIERLAITMDLVKDLDAPMYPEEEDNELIWHNVSYIYKFGPLSIYLADVWFDNLLSYGIRREVDPTDDDLDLLADAMVAIQESMGIKENEGKVATMGLEETQQRASESNPKAAHSLPSNTNGKDHEARAVQLELAEDYKSNPRKHGNPPFKGQKRLQQKGNITKSYMADRFPSKDFDKEYAHPRN